jgi:hypothetical protein
MSIEASMIEKMGIEKMGGDVRRARFGPFMRRE